MTIAEALSTLVVCLCISGVIVVAIAVISVERQRRPTRSLKQIVKELENGR